ncbi:hypothetical protein D8674_020828 [Pyrus ussuriensis x Pyrus communis]|uniref:Uncharacterized protein n=1 Tax=Pyrus ussuriensis x Pyrus communis TaxID=2448454 RepID=A0A5N5HNV2_9ROSA|nr:hypothetical protein D8674_020828 [Pyrus ussuriensis x Pyrus communis]
MSKSRRPNDVGSPSSSSMFELAMLESSWPLLESCTKKTLDDLRNCQTLANIGSSLFMGCVFYAIPIFRYEFTTDHLEKNLLDSEKQLEALRQSCSIPRGLSFHQWCYCYKMRLMKACPGYAECALTQGNIKLSGRELADVEKVLMVTKEDRHLGTSTKKEKAPMLVPVGDILFHKGARKHRVRPAPRSKSQDEVLKITALKKAKPEAIGCAAGIAAWEKRQLLPSLPTIDRIFPPTMEDIDQNGDPSSNRKRKYKKEVGSMHWKDLKVMIEYNDRLREVKRYKAKFKENKQLVNDARKTSKALAKGIRLKDQNFESLKRRNYENVRLKKQLEVTEKQLETNILEVSKVKGELDNALVGVSGLNKSILTKKNTAVQEFLDSQAFHDTFRPHCIWMANFEKRKWMAVIKRYDNGSIIRRYCDKMDKYRQRDEAFVLAVNPSNEDDSDNEASVSEQSRESEDGSVDTEDGGDDDVVETQSDIVRGSASNEDVL